MSDQTIVVIACCISWPLSIYLVLWFLRADPWLFPYIDPVFRFCGYLQNAILLKVRRTR